MNWRTVVVECCYIGDSILLCDIGDLVVYLVTGNIVANYQYVSTWCI